MKVFDAYKQQFSQDAKGLGYSEDEIKDCLDYAEHLNEQGLPIIFDQYHLSLLTGYDYVYLLGVTNYQRGYYKHYEIPKKNGGVRAIEEPLPSLKEIQTWILENILTPASAKNVSPVAKAFMPGKSLRENARFHKGKNTVVALDLHDFFGSVRFGSVYGVFKGMGYNESVSVMLTRLCMLKGSLPQGAPTSPMLSNLMFAELDREIFRYCKERKIMYTRYADDMTFSADNMDVAHLMAYVKMIVETRHLKLNEEKTKVMGRGSCQNVTGIVVNDGMQVPKKYRDKVRQEVYYCIKFGFQGHMSRVSLPEWIQTPQHYKHHRLGKVNHILMVNPKDAEFVKYAQWIKDSMK